MQFIRVMSAPVFKTTGFRMRLAVGPPLRHAIAFMKLVQENIGPFLLDDRVIYPDFILGNKLIYIVVAPGGKIYVKYTAHKPSIDDPYR